MSSIPSFEELDLLHRKICTAVGDPKRLQMMYALHEQPRNVTALAEALDMPQPTVSRHLGMLKQRGIVTGERDGQSVVYRLTDERVIGVLDTMRHILRDMLEAQSNTLDS